MIELAKVRALKDELEAMREDAVEAWVAQGQVLVKERRRRDRRTRKLHQKLQATPCAHALPMHMHRNASEAAGNALCTCTPYAHALPMHRSTI